MSAIDPRDRFIIVNTTTNKPLESWPTRHQADHFVNVANNHELKNNRPAVYAVKETTK